MSGAQGTIVHNARITLLATAFNNLGVGATIAGIVAPTLSGTLGGFGHVIAWLAIGAQSIVTAQLLLGKPRTS
jgi:hypothetical protein